MSYPDFDAPGHQVTMTWATWSRFYVRIMGGTAAFVRKTKPAGSPYSKDESEETPAREGGGQGGTKNIDALQHYSSSQSCSARRLNSFVQLLAGSCVLACDYVSYPVSCIDSPAACP